MTEPARRVVFTRSGVEFTGIAPVARAVHRVVMPILLSWTGRIAIGLLIVAGAVALIAGRPAGPQVTEHPWVDATVGLALGLAMAALHELAHAIALVHYGRTPRRAGCGFYWGALCFYVDSTDGTTLPRRARIINAMAGLAVDLVTTAVLLLIAQGFAATVLITGVCWRIAILQLIGIVENTLPILEVDGHVAFSDYLDEPDLSPRSKDALARKLRRIKHDDKPSWLAAYGAFSIVGGIVLLATSTWVWWLAAGELITSLFAGNPAEILLGLYVVLPVRYRRHAVDRRTGAQGARQTRGIHRRIRRQSRNTRRARSLPVRNAGQLLRVLADDVSDRGQRDVEGAAVDVLPACRQECGSSGRTARRPVRPRVSPAARSWSPRHR